MFHILLWRATFPDERRSLFCRTNTAKFTRPFPTKVIAENTFIYAPSQFILLKISFYLAKTKPLTSEYRIKILFPSEDYFRAKKRSEISHWREVEVDLANSLIKVVSCDHLFEQMFSEAVFSKENVAKQFCSETHTPARRLLIEISLCIGIRYINDLREWSCLQRAWKDQVQSRSRNWDPLKWQWYESNWVDSLPLVLR